MTENVGGVHIKSCEDVLASYHHGDLRSALLEAARAELDTDRAGALSLRSLAATVGVSPNAPYRHFATKEKLMAALAAQGFTELTARFARQTQGDAAQRMTGYFQDYLEFAAENPGVYQLMFGRDFNPLTCEAELVAAATACFTSLMSAVSHLSQRPMDDPRVKQGAATVWSLSHGAAMLRADGVAAFLEPQEQPTAASLAAVIVAALG
jgi:AcrR family transcriptional regulator